RLIETTSMPIPRRHGGDRVERSCDLGTAAPRIWARYRQEFQEGRGVRRRDNLARGKTMALERRLSGTRRKKRKTQEGVAVGENGDVRERLERIARNLWWSWSTEARALWDRVAAEAPEKRREELKRNPLLLVRWLSVRALRDLASDDVF